MISEEKKAARRLAKLQAEIDKEKAQPLIKTLTITIEWKRSRAGSNPAATVEGEAQGGQYFHNNKPYRASGCGYDKESTVIADACNDYLKGHLYAADLTGAPYGIQAYKNHVGLERRYFSGGIGTSCYYRIIEHLGGTMEHVASGRAFDVFRIIF
jgi:hypothetical protein